jgi:PST family polysaccharide transporter
MPYIRERLSMKKRLIENIVSLYSLQGLNYIIPMLTFPYLVRTLGVETYGLMAFAQSFGQYFNIFTDYGFNFTATRSVARSTNDSDVSSIFCTVLVVKFVLYLVGAVILGIILQAVPRFHQHAAFFVVAFVAVLGNILFPVWLFQGLQKMRYISIVSGISRIASAVMLFGFVHHPQDGLLALMIVAGGNLLAGSIGMIFAFRLVRIRWISPSVRDCLVKLREGWHLFTSSAAISLYTNTNVFLVGLIAGNEQAGYFSAAEKLIRAMNGLIQPITQATFPHVSSLVITAPARALRFITRNLRWIALLTFVPSATMLIFAKPIAVLCFGHVAAESVSVMRWIAFLPFIIGVSNVLGLQTMIPFGYDKLFSRILIISGLINVALGIPLIRAYQASGAGMSVLATEIFVTLTMTVVLIRKGINIFTWSEAKA